MVCVGEVVVKNDGVGRGFDIGEIKDEYRGGLGTLIEAEGLVCRCWFN